MIGRQLFGKQLLEVIVVGVSDYYLWWLSRNYGSAGLGIDTVPLSSQKIMLPKGHHWFK
jgi:hypothetical protein